MSSANRFEPPRAAPNETDSPHRVCLTAEPRRASSDSPRSSWRAAIFLTSCNKHDYATYTVNHVASVPGCASLLAFFWPIVFECAGVLFARGGLATWWRWPRFVRVGGSVAAITYLTLWGDAVRYGAVIAYAACAGDAGALWATLSRERRDATS